MAQTRPGCRDRARSARRLRIGSALSGKREGQPSGARSSAPQLWPAARRHPQPRMKRLPSRRSLRPRTSASKLVSRDRSLDRFEFFDLVEAAGFEPASEKRVRRRLRVYSRFEVSRLTRHVPGQPARLASPALRSGSGTGQSRPFKPHLRRPVRSPRFRLPRGRVGFKPPEPSYRWRL